MTLQFPAKMHTHQFTQHHSHQWKNIIQVDFELCTLFHEPAKFCFMHLGWVRNKVAASSTRVRSLGQVYSSHALWRTFMFSLNFALCFSALFIYLSVICVWDNNEHPQSWKISEENVWKKGKGMRVICLYYFIFCV